MNADFKPSQIRTVSFVTITSDRNDSVKILNHLGSFLPDISASILKSNYANFWQGVYINVQMRHFLSKDVFWVCQPIMMVQTGMLSHRYQLKS